MGEHTRTNTTTHVLGIPIRSHIARKMYELLRTLMSILPMVAAECGE